MKKYLRKKKRSHSLSGCFNLFLIFTELHPKLELHLNWAYVCICTGMLETFLSEYLLKI